MESLPAVEQETNAPSRLFAKVASNEKLALCGYYDERI